MPRKNLSYDTPYCTIIVLDTRRFTPRRETDKISARKALKGFVLSALKDSTGAIGGLMMQDRGDGWIVLLPQSIDNTQLLLKFRNTLEYYLLEHNRVSRRQQELRVRMAFHIGSVSVEAKNKGFTSSAVARACDLVDSDQLHTALDGSGERYPLVLAVTNRFLNEIISEHIPVLRQDFTKIRVHVKTRSHVAWLYAPSSLIHQRNPDPRRATEHGTGKLTRGRRSVERFPELERDIMTADVLHIDDHPEYPDGYDFRLYASW